MSSMDFDGYPSWSWSWRAILQLYHGKNKLHLDEMIMLSALYLTIMLSWILIVLSHWNNSPWVDMLLHSDISWFRENQSLLWFLNVACLPKKLQIPILWSFVGLELTNHYTTDAFTLIRIWNTNYSMQYYIQKIYTNMNWLYQILHASYTKTEASSSSSR